MDPTLVPGQRAWNAVLGSASDGRVLLALEQSVGPEQAPRSVYRVVDIQSGKTVAAIQAGPEDLDFSACNFRSSPHDPTVLETSSSSDMDTTSVMFGQALLAGGGYSFRLPALGGRGRLMNCGEVVLQAPGAPVIFSCFQEMLAMAEASSSQVVRVSSRTGSRAIAHFGDHVLYEEDLGGGSSRMLQWSPTEGERPASVDIGGDLCAVGMDDRLFAGALGRNMAQSWYVRCDAFYEDLRFVTRQRDSEQLALNLGPKMVERSAGANRIATRGEFVAGTVFFETRDEGAVAVTRTSDWTIRRISAHDGQALFLSALGLDDRYLYVVETPGTILVSRSVAGVYRYDLSQFDVLGHE